MYAWRLSDAKFAVAKHSTPQLLTHLLYNIPVSLLLPCVVSCVAQRENTGSSGPANALQACTPGGCLMLHGFGMALQRAG